MYQSYKNTNFLFKLLHCLFITLFLILILVGSTCFASNNSSSVTLPILSSDVTITIPEEFNNYKYQFMYFVSSEAHHRIYFGFYFSNSPIYCSKIDTDTAGNPTYCFNIDGDYIYSYGTTNPGSENFYDTFCNDFTLSYSKQKFREINGTGLFHLGFYNNYVENTEYYGEDTVYSIYTNFDLTDPSGNLITSKRPIKYPEITTSLEELQNLSFNNLSLNANDFSDQDVYLLTYDYTNSSLQDVEALYPKKEILINKDSQYYARNNSPYTYYIPRSDLGITYKSGGSYAFKFATKSKIEYEGNEIDTYNYLGDIFKFNVTGSVSSGTIDDINKERELDQLEENNKTNKGIWETIKEILSYLNPFSENFFAYKLVELILNGIKSLFVPSDAFFSTFFTDLKQWFSDRFGLLFYPFELIIDILTKISNINLSEPQFSVPEIREPSTDKVLFKAQNFNFNDLLNEPSFKTMHDIYFIIVDAIIVFAFANLIKKKLKEVETE